MNTFTQSPADSIATLRNRYKHQETTPREVIEEIIQRVQADTEMNVWITPPSLASLQPYLDGLALLDPDKAPLWGIPFAVKDNIDVAGICTTAGCPAYAYTPSKHAAVIERLVVAGAIPLGKTNMDQFATGLVGTRSPYGETHNALRPELISGGSSSGSAVAVARGHAVFALGTDTAGSGRVPAMLNRLVGYKPSLGAWPTNGVVPACESLDCVTVFAHHLEDALLVDEVVRGVCAEDPWSRHLPIPSPKLPTRILLPKEPTMFFGRYAESYKREWQTAIGQLIQMDVPIEYVEMDLYVAAASMLYEGPWVAERWAALGEFIETHPGAAFPVTERVLRMGAGSNYDAASLFHAMHQLQALKLAARTQLENAVLAMPTAGGTWTREEVRQDPIGANREMGRYTNHCNLLDLCALALPTTDADTNVPFGITLFGLAGNEHLIRGVAQRFLYGMNIAPTTDCLANPTASNQTGTTAIAVCGLHMRGYPLEKQMQEFGAQFVREAITAPKYQMLKLPTTPAKPGLVRRQSEGAAIELEIWSMPTAMLGAFVTSIPSPLCIGKIELQDGEEVSGFLCEAIAAEEAEDITRYGGWRKLPV